ncbi:hypothetical protein [Aeoliella mucimassa]|uniref:hypothetical protein n=1 Tax=Aeoliella mucimassa TaxID=2527972 RepID=UPI0018D4A7EA|nr:hypothetical protein [Aeoliella mucimassa]
MQSLPRSGERSLDQATSRVYHSSLFFRLGFEAQQYTSVRDDEEDYSLIGWTTGIGIRR